MNNIALINASPKKSQSVSEILLDELKTLLPLTSEEYSIKEHHINTACITDDVINELQSCTTWIFAFPLYVDAVPSHLLSCLRQIERYGNSDKVINVYAIVNCGLYEGKQAQNALAIMENWCIRCIKSNKANLKWRTGIGFGGGGALPSMKKTPLGRGAKTDLGKAYAAFVKAVLSHTSADNTYISINIPRFLYKLVAEIRWVKMIKANGGKKADLGKRLNH